MINKDFELALKKNAILLPREYFEIPSFNPSYNLITTEWGVGLGYVFKRFWDDKYKFSESRKIVKGLEYKGLWLTSLFELCERCSSFSTSYKFFYDNATDWFMASFYELMVRDLKKLFEPSIRESKQLKKAWVAEDRYHWDLMRKFKNPYEDSQYTALNLLTQTSIQLTDKSSMFTKKRWNPYLRAYGNYLTNIIRNPDYGEFAISDRINVQTGRGKGGEVRINYGDTISCRVLMIEKMSID